MSGFCRCGPTSLLRFLAETREGRDEYFFLPKAPAIPDARPAPPLVGSEKAPDAARADQRRLRAAERVPRIRIREGWLDARSSQTRNARFEKFAGHFLLRISFRLSGLKRICNQRLPMRELIRARSIRHMTRVSTVARKPLIPGPFHPRRSGASARACGARQNASARSLQFATNANSSAGAF